MRTQWHHVIDIAPTVLEAAGLPVPEVVNGTAQTPFEGVSLAYTFDDAKAKDRHTTQYFEIFGNRAIYHDGWLAAHDPQGAVGAEAARRARRRTCGNSTTRAATSAWRTTWPAKNPDKLKELQALFLKEAVKYNVLPLDDRASNASIPRAGRAARSDGRPHVADALRGHDRHDGERVHQREEPLAHDHRRGRDSQGRRQRRDPRAGRPLRRLEPVPEGRQADLHLQLGSAWNARRSLGSEPLPAGKATVMLDFAYDGGGLGKGGTATLSVNGQKVAEGASPHDRRPSLLGR